MSWTNSKKHKTAKTQGKKNLNRPIKNKETESIIKNFSTKKAQDKFLHW